MVAISIVQTFKTNSRKLVKIHFPLHTHIKHSSLKLITHGRAGTAHTSTLFSIRLIQMKNMFTTNSIASRETLLSDNYFQLGELQRVHYLVHRNIKGRLRVKFAKQLWL